MQSIYAITVEQLGDHIHSIDLQSISNQGGVEDILEVKNICLTLNKRSICNQVLRVFCLKIGRKIKLCTVMLRIVSRSGRDLVLKSI